MLSEAAHRALAEQPDARALARFAARLSWARRAAADDGVPETYLQPLDALLRDLGRPICPRADAPLDAMPRLGFATPELSFRAVGRRTPRPASADATRRDASLWRAGPTPPPRPREDDPVRPPDAAARQAREGFSSRRDVLFPPEAVPPPTASPEWLTPGALAGGLWQPTPDLANAAALLTSTSPAPSLGGRATTPATMPSTRPPRPRDDEPAYFSSRGVHLTNVETLDGAVLHGALPLEVSNHRAAASTHVSGAAEAAPPASARIRSPPHPSVRPQDHEPAELSAVGASHRAALAGGTAPGRQPQRLTHEPAEMSLEPAEVWRGRAPDAALPFEGVSVPIVSPSDESSLAFRSAELTAARASELAPELLPLQATLSR